MAKSTTHHLRVSIRGFLLEAIDLEALRGVFQSDDGRELAPIEAFDSLIDKLEKGHKFISCGGCDGFDPIKGCPGHPSEPQQPGVELRD